MRLPILFSTNEGIWKRWSWIVIANVFVVFIFIEGGGRKAKLNHIYNKLCFSIREPKLESMVIKNKWDNMNWRATTNFASNVTYTTYAIVNTSPMIALLF